MRPHQHWRAGASENLTRHATEHESRQSAATMRTHGDQVDVHLAGDAHDGGGRFTHLDPSFR
jgi:hypothetical protein